MPRAWPLIALLTLTSPLLAQEQGATPITPPKAAEKPAVFSDKSYADAIAASKGSGKITIVKFTAEWCAPCKAMNRTTFVDPKVISWFGEPGGNGLIIEVDVDKDPKIAQAANVGPIPTLIAYKDGVEFDRTLGYRPADSLLDWLNAVKAGRRNGEDLAIKVEKSKQGQGGAAVSMQDRLTNAKNLVVANKLDEATAEYAWLWDNILKEEPAMVGVRASFMASDMEQLAKQHPAAKERFTTLRDAAQQRYQNDPKDFNALGDWIALNRILGDNAQTLAWFDRAKNQEQAWPAIKANGFPLERLMIESNRLADAAALCPDPLERVQRDFDISRISAKGPATADEDLKKMLEQSSKRFFYTNTANLYTGLLLAKRDGDASKLAAAAFKLDESPALKVAMIRTALDNHVAKPEFKEWLDAADKAGQATDELKQRLDQQLAK
jgi:thioredoxin 1